MVTVGVRFRVRFKARVNIKFSVRVRVIQLAILYCNCEATQQQRILNVCTRYYFYYFIA